jgi:hypothetical protein
MGKKRVKPGLLDTGKMPVPQERLRDGTQLQVLSAMAYHDALACFNRLFEDGQDAHPTGIDLYRIYAKSGFKSLLVIPIAILNDFLCIAILAGVVNFLPHPNPPLTKGRE